MLGKFYWAVTNFINYFKMVKLCSRVGKGIQTYGKILFKVSKTSTVKIGNGTIIRSHWRSNPAGGGQHNCIIAVSNGATLEIGNNVGISNSTIYCQDHIIIEDNVMIGVNCVIYDTDFHSVYFENRMYGNIDIKHSTVQIKNGAWIGGHCIILKGVTIGEKAVVGAGSVVTKSIPANEIWAGNPAKFIKRLD